MPTFSSISKFKEYIRSTAKDVMADEGKKLGEKSLTDAKLSTIYAQPSEYSTGGFLNATDSSVFSSVNLVHLSVFDNPDKMPPHPSWIPDIYGDNQNKSLSHWLNAGHGGIVSIEGYHFYEKAIIEFNKDFKNEIKKGFKKRGINSK